MNMTFFSVLITNKFNFTNSRNVLVNVYFMYIRFQMHRLDTVDFM